MSVSEGTCFGGAVRFAGGAVVGAASVSVPVQTKEAGDPLALKSDDSDQGGVT